MFVREKTSASSVEVRRRVERESERPRAAPVVVPVVVAGTAVTGRGILMGVGNAVAAPPAPRAPDVPEFMSSWNIPKSGEALPRGEWGAGVAGERYEGVRPRLTCCCLLMRRCFRGHL